MAVMGDIKKRKGFTLVELVIVMTIIAVLAVLVIGAITLARQQSRNTTLRNDAKLLKTAVEAHYAKYKSFPAAPSGANDRNGYTLFVSGGALNEFMTDPSNPPTNQSRNAGKKGAVCYNMLNTDPTKPYYRIWIVPEEKADTLFAGVCTAPSPSGDQTAIDNVCRCGMISGVEVFGPSSEY